MSSSRGNDKSAFGRDEMTALLGGGLSESLTRPVQAAAAAAGKKRKATVSGKDVADMTTAETAAWLLEQQKERTGVQAPQASRHRARTSKARNYQQLLHEQQQQQQLAEESQKTAQEKPISREDSSDDEDDFAARQKKRSKAAAVRTKAAPVILRKRRYDSSSSSSSEDESDHDDAPQRRRRRKRVDSSSSSDDDDDSEADRRRQRLLKQRQRRQATEEWPEEEEEEIVKHAEIGTTARQVDDKPISDTKAMEVSEQQLEKIKPAPQKADRSSSEEESSSSSESDSSSSEDSSDDDDDEEEIVIAKPLFVPKHKRGTVKTFEEQETEQVAQEEKLQLLEEKRKQESRAMVQQAVAAAAQAVPDFDSALEGITGARNEMPDDTDDVDADKARDAWEVRELLRLLADWDLELARQHEERELARRRQMTDEERLQEDIETGRYQRPGQRPQQEGEGRYMQRYFHRGAYYMDETEFDESDVRHKAAEYARAATGSDKIDKRSLPKVMQVKKFGFANQNLRYKGLAAEDTTDTQMEVLPLVNKKGPRKRS